MSSLPLVVAGLYELMMVHARFAGRLFPTSARTYIAILRSLASVAACRDSNVCGLIARELQVDQPDDVTINYLRVVIDYFQNESLSPALCEALMLAIARKRVFWQWVSWPCFLFFPANTDTLNQHIVVNACAGLLNTATHPTYGNHVLSTFLELVQDENDFIWSTLAVWISEFQVGEINSQLLASWLLSNYETCVNVKWMEKRNMLLVFLCSMPHLSKPLLSKYDSLLVSDLLNENSAISPINISHRLIFDAIAENLGEDLNFALLAGNLSGDSILTRYMYLRKTYSNFLEQAVNGGSRMRDLTTESRRMCSTWDLDLSIPGTEKRTFVTSFTDAGARYV